ncbi:NHL repeat-containing protein [Marinomonas epiphytica]
MKWITLTAGLLSAQMAFAEPNVLWEFNDFKMPESVLLDRDRQQIYVSNINGEPLKEDGNGSIGLISADGSSHQVEWVLGLDSPKGLAQRGKYLYVADVKELVVINVDTAKVSARYPVPEAGVLNGLAFDENGVLYVSDWLENRIYKLKDQELSVWLETPQLESPNGLVVKEGSLYVASWGGELQADFSTLSSGLLKRISLTTKKIEDFRGEKTWMNLDGLHPYTNGWLATDFMKGELLNLSSQGRVLSSLSLAQTSADFWFDEVENLLLVPYFITNRVAAYRFTPEIFGE